MATPMEYDTLREIYSSAMASLTRLELHYKVDIEKFKDDENKFVQVWIDEVKRKDLEDIDYRLSTDKMNNASKAWMTLNQKLFDESEKTNNE